jgi:hypothetical protein
VSTKPKRPPKDWNGPSLRAVFIGLAVLSVVMGVLAYYRYSQSERSIMQGMPRLEAGGVTRSAEQCIDEVLAWHKGCEGLSFMCNDAVTQAMFHCLKVRDRSEECAALDPDEVSRGQWVYYKCKDRGSMCKRTKQCPCADAYRAFDSFCRTDQKAVQVAL